MGRPLAIVAVLLAIAVTRSAHADSQAVTYGYAIESGVKGRVLVAWPRSCGSTGDPLGAVSLALNPDWVGRLHEVDYEVIDPGSDHAVSPYCAKTMRLYALLTDAFPRDRRVATADDAALGKKTGETLTILPALDAIELPGRIPFFAGDPRRAKASRSFDVVTRAPSGSRLRGIRDVFAVPEALPEGALEFELTPKFVVYTYEGGGSERLPFDGRGRPGPTRAGVAEPPTADASAEPNVVDAGAQVDAGVVSAAPAPAPDRGTRWVYAAAIGGLVAGGIIAHFRKKRASK